MGQLEATREVIAGWAAIHPETDVGALAVAQRLIWCGRITEDILERAALAAGFRRRGDYEVLALLRRSEPSLLSPADVAASLLTSASGMTGKVDRLESQGLLERRRDVDDRRAVGLVITDAGRDLADRTFDMGLNLYQRMLAELTEDERETLDTLLSTMLGTLDSLYRVRRPWESVQ